MKMFNFTGNKLGTIVGDKLCGNPMSGNDRFKGIDNTTGCGTAEFHNFWISGKVVDHHTDMVYSLATLEFLDGHDGFL